jgi:hypothetical protein
MLLERSGAVSKQQQQLQQETVAGKVGNWFEAAAVAAAGGSNAEDVWKTAASKVHNRYGVAVLYGLYLWVG